MSFYQTDKIDIKRYEIDPETGAKILKIEHLNVECRVELYNKPILSNSGKEEKAVYLIMLEDFELNFSDGIVVKSVLGQTVSKKEYDIKNQLPLGGYSYEQSEVYVG